MSGEQNKPAAAVEAEPATLAGKARWVYSFDEGSAEMRELLGNKGANLAEMTHILGAEKVPGGFTVTTEACVEYMRTGGRLPAGLEGQIAYAVGELEQANAKRFGDPDDPLLLSVRSGDLDETALSLDERANAGFPVPPLDRLTWA